MVQRVWAEGLFLYWPKILCYRNACMSILGGCLCLGIISSSYIRRATVTHARGDENGLFCRQYYMEPRLQAEKMQCDTGHHQNTNCWRSSQRSAGFGGIWLNLQGLVGPACSAIWSKSTSYGVWVAPRTTQPEEVDSDPSQWSPALWRRGGPRWLKISSLARCPNKK